MRKVKQAHGGAIVHAAKGETANPNGRPPRLLSTIVSDLKAKGYERATAGTVVEAFEMLLNVPEKELAEMVNVHYQTIGYLERGEYSPSLALALRISEALNIDVQSLFSIKPFPKGKRNE